jgi:hypothetical protein
MFLHWRLHSISIMHLWVRGCSEYYSGLQVCRWFKFTDILWQTCSVGMGAWLLLPPPQAFKSCLLGMTLRLAFRHARNCWWQLRDPGLALCLLHQTRRTQNLRDGSLCVWKFTTWAQQGSNVGAASRQCGFDSSVWSLCHLSDQWL